MAPIKLKIPPKRKPGQKAGLTRSTIAKRAVGLLDQNPKFNVLAIAKALKVASAAVYAHFPRGLPEIETEMVKVVLADVARPFQPNESWDAYLRSLFVAMFEAFHKHPRVGSFAGREIASDYCLNPALVERVLFALSLAGLADDKKADALDLVMGCLVGMLTIECAGVASASPEKWCESQSSSVEGLPASEYPGIKALKRKLAKAIKERSGQPIPARAERYADQCIVGLKAQLPSK